MRLSRVVRAFATAAPLLAARAVAETQEETTVKASSPSTFSYRLPFDDSNDAYRFDIQTTNYPQERACGNTQLRLHNEDLRRDWHSTSHGNLIGTADSSVQIRSERTGRLQSLDLTIASSCLSSFPGAEAVDAEQNDAEASADVVEMTTVVVKSIDQTPLDAASGFNIYLDQASSRILQVTQASHEDVARALRPHSPKIMDELANERVHLDQLKAHLEAVTADVLASEARIQQLDHDASHKHKCNFFTCCVAAFFRGVRSNIRILIQKIPSLVDSQDKCPRSQAVLGTCRPKEPRPVSTTSVMNTNSITSSSSSSSSSPVNLRLDNVHDHLILSALVLAAVFCFSAILFTVCRFCFSARAQAEWRANCEERRTRAQFRRLQRHHEIKTWWNRLLGRTSIQRTGDYDEKRRLILSQEHVLENVMQDEIYRIRVESGMTPEEAWAARLAADGTTETLPPYRAQVTDGPPSYRTTPSDTASITLSRRASSSGSAPTVSDVTPDSSIANLSPRHSSETLRTDGGFA